MPSFWFSSTFALTVINWIRCEAQIIWHSYYANLLQKISVNSIWRNITDHIGKKLSQMKIREPAHFSPYIYIYIRSQLWVCVKSKLFQFSSEFNVSSISTHFVCILKSAKSYLQWIPMFFAEVSIMDLLQFKNSWVRLILHHFDG